MTNSTGSEDSTEREVRAVYRQLLESWDNRNARDYAAVFTAGAYLVGFDGSQVFGQSEIGSHVTKIFSHHQTGRYASIVRAVQSLTGDVAILTAVAGMVPAGKDELEPSLNAVQTMVAVREGNAWKIALFQNTPAAWHGRTEDSKNLTEELRNALEPRPKT